MGAGASAGRGPAGIRPAPRSRSWCRSRGVPAVLGDGVHLVCGERGGGADEGHPARLLEGAQSESVGVGGEAAAPAVPNQIRPRLSPSTVYTWLSGRRPAVLTRLKPVTHSPFVYPVVCPVVCPVVSYGAPGPPGDCRTVDVDAPGAAEPDPPPGPHRRASRSWCIRGALVPVKARERPERAAPESRSIIAPAPVAAQATPWRSTARPRTVG